MSIGYPFANFGQPKIHIFWCTIQWDEKELGTHFTPNMYFWTPNSEILAKALDTERMQKQMFSKISDSCEEIAIVARVVATVGSAGRGRPPLMISARHKKKKKNPPGTKKKKKKKKKKNCFCFF